jgi:hypothetical protein
MLQAMSLRDWFRRLFSSSRTDASPAPAEEDAAQSEPYVAPEGEADLERMEKLSGGAVMPGLAAGEGAAAAEAQIESQEGPPDRNP